MPITISTIETLIPEANRDLVFRFLLVFSRFEYALKRGTLAGGSEKEVKPDWDAFAKAIEGKFKCAAPPELASACEYLRANPPKKQVKENQNKLGWREPEEFTPDKPLAWLLLRVRCIRNNVFHGGKFPFGPIEDPARNRELIEHALTILEACLPLHDEVNKAFTEVD